MKRNNQTTTPNYENLKYDYWKIFSEGLEKSVKEMLKEQIGEDKVENISKRLKKKYRNKEWWYKSRLSPKIF